MDTVTQIALGATIGEAGFRKKLGGKATLAGAVCGLVPDLDTLVTSDDRFVWAFVHRGCSHSIFVLSMSALFLGWVFFRWSGRRGTYLTWAHLCFWALVTHPLLDVCTSWGTQLLAPFDRHRFTIDAVAILDPLYSLPLFVASTFACLRRHWRERSRRFARAVLVVTTVYLALGFVQSSRASAAARHELQARGVRITKLRAMPTFLNNQLFRIVAEDRSGALHIGYLSLMARTPVEFVTLAPVHDPRIDEVLEDERGVLFRWVTQGYYDARIMPGRDDTPIVEVRDQRFGLFAEPVESRFFLRATFASAGSLERVRFEALDATHRIDREFRSLWRLLLGKPAATRSTGPT